jgi:hypothetical protein
MHKFLRLKKTEGTIFTANYTKEIKFTFIINSIHKGKPKMSVAGHTYNSAGPKSISPV